MDSVVHRSNIVSFETKWWGGGGWGSVRGDSVVHRSNMSLETKWRWGGGGGEGRQCLYSGSLFMSLLNASA